MSDRIKTVYSKGNNFVIDNSNNKIGINKASPEESLDVSGNIKFSGEIIGNINYNNLTNKPTIPSGNQVIDWTETSAVKINTNNYINTTYSVGDGGLTEKNFTTVLNTKLNSIAEGAQVNVKADWNATAGEAQEILNKPTIPSGNQVIDWTETSAVKINTNNYINTTYSVGDGGLTEKNFTTVLNTKLNGIAEGAQVNVKADWNATAGEAQEILNKPIIPTNNNQLTNGAGYVTQSNIDTAIANLVSTAPEHLDTLKELADAIEDTSNNKITALTTSIAEKLSTSDAQATYATVASVTTQLNGKQDALIAGANITIAQDGTISAQAGTTINSLNDIADVDVNTKDDGQVLKWNATSSKWEAKDENAGSGGSGNGVALVPSTAQQSDLSGNTSYPNAHSGTGTEGDIIYDVSKNKFYEASNSKEDGQTGGEIKFRELGYSFFSEHMEGQPPAPSFFFFSITPSSIKINWTNPIQYHSGVSNLNDSYVDTTNGELSATVNSNGNIYFPVVNRIMIQIYNKQTQSYESWGDKRSPITSNTASSGGVDGLKNGYVLCSKNYPIPPMGTSVSPYFGTRDSIGRTTKVYELQDFADSIILYKKDNTPENSTISPTIQNNKLASSIKEESNLKELNISSSGYEIKLWLENQYDSGSMTENDFNVVTLTQDNDGNDINFQTVDPPTNPISVQSKIAFNDLGNVSDGTTYIELAVKDPKNTSQTTTGDFNNINLTRIKIQYANVEDVSTITETSWKDVSKIYWNNITSYTSNSPSFQSELLSSSNFSNGIHIIDRVNDHSSINDSDTTTIRYYYIKIDSQFLSTITNYNANSKFIFRVSYKNASNDNFGLFKESNVININKPNKPTISEIIMTSYNTFTVTLASFSDTEDIIGDTTEITNNNMGVFLRNINFNVAYQYSDETAKTDITTFTGINGGESSQTTSTNTSVYINTTSFDSSTYTYTLPAGFYPDGSTNTNPITYYFSASVQNNLISSYSEVSDQQSIQITKPDQTSDSINFTILDSTSNKNNTLRVSWSHPTDGERGIVTSQSSTGLPKIQKYTFKSTYLKDNNDNTNVDHGVTDINSASNRNSDPLTTKEFTFYDALKYDGSNLTKTIDGGLDIEIKEYNEYVNNSSTFSSSISATATKPGEATNLSNDAINILTSTTNNNTTIRWTVPSTSERGLTIGGQPIDNTIIQYDISIDRATTNKYLLGKIAGGSFTTTNYYTTITNSDNSSDKTSTTDPTTSLSLVKTLGGNDMFLWPDSTYNYEVKTTNSLGYQTTGVDSNFTTQAPSIPSGLNYFDNSRLATLYTSKTTNLSNHSHYSNKGILVSTDITTSTSYSGTPVQITKLFSTSKPTDITSNTVHHVLNKTSFQDSTWNNSNETVVSWTDNNPDVNSNQSQFKVFNVAPSTDIEVYTIGTPSDFSTDSGDNKDSVGIKFDITRAYRQDGYKYNSNYDSRNYGYWYSESVQYSITFTTGSVRIADLYTPLKYELRSYYNTSGNGSVSTNANGSTTILQNTNNTNGYIYFDDSCTTTPSISKYSGSDMITYTTNNKINGIPNLHLFNSQTATIALTYTAGGYSKRYLLNKDLNALEHYFSYSTGNKKAIITWNNHTSSAPSISSNKYERQQNQWNVSGLSITSFPSTSTATVGITLKITAQNTFGTANVKTIGSGDSAVYNFIYDKPSADLINQSGINIMEVPSSFNPDYNQTYAKTELTVTMSNFSSTGSTTNNNQLNLWNGYFYSRDGWQTATSINTNNCAIYGMSNTLPVFNGQDSDYKYVIFKYTRTMPDGNANRIICALKGSSSSNDPEVHIDDLRNDNVDVFLYTGTAMSDHYWLNISKGNTALTLADAYNQAITYVGNLGDGIYTSGSKGIDNSTFINSSGLSNDFTNSSALGGSMPRRVIGAYINRLDFSAGNILTFYIAIRIKNNINKKVEKPDLWLSGENTSSKTYKFS